METQTGPAAVIERIQSAVNDHALDALAACFHPQYQSDQPLHPDRAFRGSEQMRKNWAQIFGTVPDIRAEVLRSAVDGDTAWTEWDMRGTRVDGAPSHTAMVTIAEVQHDQVVWIRLYMEQVQEGEGIDAAVRADLSRDRASR